MARRKTPRKHPLPAAKATSPDSRPGGKLGLSNGLAWFVLILFTLLAYANAWPDALVFDDRVFVDSSRFSGLGLGDLWRFFSEDLWASSGEDSSLYRPLLLLWIAAQSRLLGDWLAGYHLVNIGLHVLATGLVYGLICQLLQRCGQQPGAARQIALLAGLLFGVHPIHTEVVNSIFNGSEILVTIGVAGGLQWFLGKEDRQPIKAWLGLNLVFLLILFCRESAASLPLLVVAVLWLISNDSWQLRLRACVPVISMLLPLGIYLALRSHALSPENLGVEAIPGEPVSTLDKYGVDFGLAKLAPAVLLWFEAWKVLLWPHPLQIYYDPPQTNVWIALAAQVAVLAGAMMAYLRKQPLLLIGMAVFYLAILPSSRIISEPGTSAILSDRIIYLPSLGFAIICAVGLRLLAQKFSLNAAVVLTLVIIAVLAPLTWARNADWADDIRLFEADYRKLEIKNPILNTMLAAQLREQNYKRAVQLCDENRQLIQDGHAMGAHCGSAYSQVGRFRDAEQAYLSVRSSSIRVFADFNLGLMYIHLGRRTEAEERIALAIAAEPKDFLRNYFQAVALMQMHPWDRNKLLEAQEYLQRALELQPQHSESRAELESLKKKLNGVPPAR